MMTSDGDTTLRQILAPEDDETEILRGLAYLQMEAETARLPILAGMIGGIVSIYKPSTHSKDTASQSIHTEEMRNTMSIRAMLFFAMLSARDSGLDMTSCFVKSAVEILDGEIFRLQN